MTDEIKTQLIELATVHIRSLLETHINGILNTADLDDRGQCRVGLSLVIDTTGKVPAGGVKISFAAKTSDEAGFRCDDPDQEKMDLG